MTVWTQGREALARLSLAKWHGTPHHNRIAVPGVGVDCIKFVYEVCYDSGVWPRVEFSGYDLQAGLGGPSTKLQETFLKAVFGEWVERDFQFGDVLIFTTGERSAHCGFHAGDGKLWHSLAGRRVTVSDECLWRHDLAGAVRLTGVGFKVNPQNFDFNG
jgi:cell wall-associated NlpC family hydrolase